MVAPSQGVHLVVDRDFLPGDHALLVPKTRDGRVLFAVPWLGKVILGTTDTPRHDLSREPLAFAEEVEFILGEAAKYLARPPSRSDVKSTSSEDRRVGKECVSTCRYRWSPYHSKKNKERN